MGSVQEQQASQEWCINGMADPADDVPWFWLYAAARKAAERERQRVLADADADAALDDSGLDGHTYGKDAPQRQVCAPCSQLFVGSMLISGFAVFIKHCLTSMHQHRLAPPNSVSSSKHVTWPMADSLATHM